MAKSHRNPALRGPFGCAFAQAPSQPEAAGPKRAKANSCAATRTGRSDAAAKSASEEGGAVGNAARRIHPDHFRCREFESAGKTGACASRQKCRSRSLHERGRAWIGICDRCAAQRLFQLEFRRAQFARLSIHRHRNIPEPGCAARGIGDFGKPFRQRMRCDLHSGISIGAALHRRRKGHPEVIRRDRKTRRTSAVPKQRRRTSDPDADRRQWMRDHRHQRSVCRGCSHGSDDSSTCAHAEGITIPHADSEMIKRATLAVQASPLCLVTGAWTAALPKSDKVQSNG